MRSRSNGHHVPAWLRIADWRIGRWQSSQRTTGSGYSSGLKPWSCPKRACVIRVRLQSEVENTLSCSGQKKREKTKLTLKSSWSSWAASGLWYELGPGSPGDEYVWKLNGSGEGLVWSGDMTPVDTDVGR